MLHRMMDDPPTHPDPNSATIDPIAAAGDRAYLCPPDNSEDLGVDSGCAGGGGGGGGGGGSAGSQDAERAHLLRRVGRAVVVARAAMRQWGTRW